MTKLTETLEYNSDLLEEQLDRPTPNVELGNNLFARLRQDRQREKGRRLARLQMLSQAIKVKIDICPCGKHKGIQFRDRDETVLDVMCPVDWWVRQTWLAYEKGTLSRFLKSTPLEKYLVPYIKK